MRSLRSEERRVGKECRSGWWTVTSSRRRHTRCLSDWSSDVCSSDLDRLLAALTALERLLLGLDQLAQRGGEIGLAEHLAGVGGFALLARVREVHRTRVLPLLDALLEIGRASCRERV